jgi:hypothetical protein
LTTGASARRKDRFGETEVNLMRIQLVVAAILPLLASGCIENVPEQAAPTAEVQEPAPLGCTLRAEPTCGLGQVPDVTVAIINQTNADIYLVGSLDKSDCRWRYPHCYFEVTGPDGKSPVEEIIGCLHTSTLREEDFVKVPPGGTFDPFQEIDDYGFFFASRQLNPHTFRAAGEYRIRFVYSTRSDDIGAWAGESAWTPAQYEKVVGLFRQVPKVEVQSNEIKVTVVDRGKERPR